MLRVLSVLFLFLNVCVIIEPKPNATRRVLGGVDLQDDIRRFLVRINISKYNGSTGICTGSIIRWSWIITAAHCINKVTDRSLTIMDITPTGYRTIAQVDIRDTVTHPKYILEGTGRDIGLIHLKQPVSIFPDKRLVNFAAINPSFGPTAVIAGYGETEPNVNPPRQGTVTIVRCPNPSLTVICSQGIVRVGHGDSGGPLLFNGVLVGVISTSCTDAKTNTMCLSMYASIAQNIDWINSVIKTQ